ncbi:MULTISPECIES: ABC transporter permease [Brevibacterium]|uniref:ABC transporter permease n=1 Tax=Brevibacterium salitolerans TaxID=1403566 RepID=A0ABN2X1G6_9MICO|nr:ABC transporter permease [Brevibacterium sp.]
MRSFIVRRVGLALLQLVVVATIVFLLIRLIPGDAARAVLGENATDDQIAAMRSTMGLDDSLPMQFVNYWAGLFTGDLGISLISGRPVAGDLIVRFGNSMEIIVLAILLSLIVGVVLGRIAAVRNDRPIDHILTGGSVLGISLPVFVTGTLLLLVFAIWLPVLPPQRYVSLFSDPLGHLQLVVLPVIALAATSTAVIMRMTRSAMLETLGADFVRTVRAKGVPERQVVSRHALRNALVPVVAITSVELATLIGSTVLVETIFGWPGVSSMLMQAVTDRDYPVIQAVVLSASVFVIVVNLLADLVIRVLDPRTEAI